MEQTTEDLFVDWWEQEVEAFAEHMRLSTKYVEEEFIIDGELIPVFPKMNEDDEAAEVE